MKTKHVILFIAISLLLNGCLVNSLHPFYEEKDIYFDEKLIGTWLDQDSSKWHFEKMYLSYGENKEKEEYITNGYVARYSPKDVWNNKKNNEEVFSMPSADLDVFLFKINNQLYADFCPTMFPTFKSFGSTDFSNLHKVSTHTLAKINIEKEKLELIWFNGQWLAELIENNRIKISHEFIPFSKPYSKYYKGQYVLTASTKELQSFIKKYGDDPNAFVRKKELPKDGIYTWNVGSDSYTGKMTFREDSISYNYNLKKIDDNKN